MSKPTEINFKLLLEGKNIVRIIEEGVENFIHFDARNIISNPVIVEMVCAALGHRFHEIIQAHLEKNKRAGE